MVRSVVRSIATWACAAMMAAAPAASYGQNAEPKPAEQGKAGEPGKDAARIDDIADASRTMTGPAARSECVWLGERAVGLMWRDDLDTAFRHLDLYDRFGCPGGHVQAAFRCLTRFFALIDPKVPESLSGRVHACWINPAAQPQTAAAAPPAASATSGTAPPPAAAAPAAAPATAPAK
jgi:hypothetical protein